MDVIFSFNPCFNGFFFSISRRELCRYILRVSILVLMDSSFQSKKSSMHGSRALCFNPCFNGFFFSISRTMVHITTMGQVSILVLMDSSFQFGAFQGITVCICVSILVLMDSSFQSKNIKALEILDQFQSLF